MTNYKRFITTTRQECKISKWLYSFCRCILIQIVALTIANGSIMTNEAQLDCFLFKRSNHSFEKFQYSNASCISYTIKDNKLKLECKDGLEEQWLQNISCNVIELKLISWPDEYFPTTLISETFPLLESLDVRNSNFSKFADDFPVTASRLKIINLTGLNNLTLTSTLLSNLEFLESLDLRGNMLTTIHPDFISSPPKLKEIFMKDNKWNCSDHAFQWLAYLDNTSESIAKDRISDYKQLTCQGTMYPGKPVHVVMDILKILHDECPKECSCHLTNLVRNLKGILVPVSTTDCRFRGLRAMPTVIPSITKILLLHGNNITELKPLVQNAAYKKVTDVYFDNNKLTSVGPLEGADWLLSFRLLSLKGNNISQLPTYAFEYAFEYNLNIAHVYLGNNPWHCSCHFTPSFQDLLLKYKTVVADTQDIRCKIEESEVSNARISTLSRSTICHPEEGQLHVVDIINILMASMILIIVVKFGYDYYYFKKSGRLPWIASKIP